MPTITDSADAPPSDAERADETPKRKGQRCTLLEAVTLLVRSYGWPVFPVEPNGKAPLGSLAPHGLKDATTDLTIIAKWWASEPNANVGVVTGAASGVWVLDSDPTPEHPDPIAELEAKYGPLPPTPMSHTPSGGRHLWFKHPGQTIRNRAKFAPGLDVRGDGGYVVDPPSVGANGKPYEWHAERHPDHTPFADAPDWLIKLVRQESGKGKPTATNKPGAIKEGQRNLTLTSYAGALKARGLTRRETLAALLQMNADRCVPPLPTAEVRQIIVSIWRYQPLPPKLSRTDTGNGLRLLARFGAVIRYVPLFKRWYVWTGQRWQPDDAGFVRELAKDTARGISDEVPALQARLNATTNQDERAALTAAIEGLHKWAASSLSMRGLDAMIKAAESDPRIVLRPDQLDADPMLFNVANGTINLKAGQLQPHNRADYITKISPVAYDPQAQAPRWSAFLSEIFPGMVGMPNYIQKVMRYWLSGDVREEVMHFAYGDGANGKSKFTDVGMHLLGDYAIRVPSEMLMSKGNGGIPNDVARLKSARFVSTSETEQGKRLNESRVKDITGGDKISARFLYAEWFDFWPSHKVWMFGNYKPAIIGTDEGIWRRLHLIPFEAQFKGADRDTDLLAKLLAESAGILTWAVRGCVRWQSEGLDAPPEVIEATRSYREEMDRIGNFIADECEIDAERYAESSAFYARFKDWSKDNGFEFPITMPKVKEEMIRRGFECKRVTGGWRYVGIGLRPHPETVDLSGY